jgi:hypothetical protein
MYAHKISMYLLRAGSLGGLFRGQLRASPSHVLFIVLLLIFCYIRSLSCLRFRCKFAAVIFRGHGGGFQPQQAAAQLGQLKGTRITRMSSTTLFCERVRHLRVASCAKDVLGFTRSRSRVARNGAVLRGL